MKNAWPGCGYLLWVSLTCGCSTSPREEYQQVLAATATADSVVVTVIGLDADEIGSDSLRLPLSVPRRYVVSDPAEVRQIFVALAPGGEVTGAEASEVSEALTITPQFEGGKAAAGTPAIFYVNEQFAWVNTPDRMLISSMNPKITTGVPGPADCERWEDFQAMRDRLIRADFTSADPPGGVTD